MQGGGSGGHYGITCNHVLYMASGTDLGRNRESLARGSEDLVSRAAGAGIQESSVFFRNKIKKEHV